MAGGSGSAEVLTLRTPGQYPCITYRITQIKMRCTTKPDMQRDIPTYLHTFMSGLALPYSDTCWSVIPCYFTPQIKISQNDQSLAFSKGWGANIAHPPTRHSTHRTRSRFYGKYISQSHGHSFFRTTVFRFLGTYPCKPSHFQANVLCAKQESQNPITIRFAMANTATGLRQ